MSSFSSDEASFLFMPMGRGVYHYPQWKTIGSHNTFNYLETSNKKLDYYHQYAVLYALASKAEVNAALENKADKADIPVVPTVVSAFENDAHYLTEHQDISNLASKDELEAVEAQIPDVSAALEPYALKTELPDTTGLASKAEVNAALENKADKNHTHEDVNINISKLREILNNKSDTGHKHVIKDITDFELYDDSEIRTEIENLNPEQNTKIPGYNPKNKIPLKSTGNTSIPYEANKSRKNKFHSYYSPKFDFARKKSR